MAAATKSIERDYAKQARAAELAMRSRRGALKRGGADIATSGAAIVSGNPGYAMANLAQAGIKLSGAFEGVSMGAIAAAAGVTAVSVAAVAAVGGMAVVTEKIGQYGLEQAASLETLQIQLTGLLGSVQKGSDEMNFLLNLGKESVVPTDSLIQADRLMLAFGVTVDSTRRELVTFMSDFGTATGATQEQVYFLSLALGQVASFGRANSVDMRQLANAGINTMQVYGIIGKSMGLTAKQVAAGVKDGIVTADRLYAALAIYDKKFATTAEAARKSTAGLLANIKDTVNIEMGKAFLGLNKQLSGFLSGVFDSIQKIDFSAIARAVESVWESIQAAFNGMGANGADLADFFSTTLPTAINVTSPG